MNSAFRHIPFLTGCLSAIFAIPFENRANLYGQSVFPDSPTTAYKSTAIGSFSFQVRTEFDLELVADESVVRWPIAATWDHDGNLIVAESAGVKQSVQDQLQSKPHRIVRLIDQDRDGRFESRQIVADQMSFPEGVLVYGKHLLVSAPPQIWKLTDGDGDGIYEERAIWHDGKTLTGCANDLHGPFLGPEGWIYWSKSAFAKQSFPLRHSFVEESTASHLYRKPFDAKTADRVMTGGMDNLVHVAFDRDGDRFFVSTFLHHPGKGLRDGIGHAAYGSVFGKNHAVLDGHPKTGPLMLPIVELGPAAPSGLIVTSSPTPWQTQTEKQCDQVLIAAQFNLQRVSAHSLLRQGSAYISQNSDLVVADQLDFHPVCVLEDVDGTLLIVDTGGWYDLCCPSSGKEERVAPGGVYRLRPNGNRVTRKDAWRETKRLIEQNPALALTHQNARVREHASMSLLGPDAHPKQQLLDSLRTIVGDMESSADTRKGAFWALAKSLALSKQEIPTRDEVRPEGFNKAPSFVEQVLTTKDEALLPSALELTATYAWPDQANILAQILVSHPNAQIKRLAADALGRIGSAQAIPFLLEEWEELTARSKTADRTLEHSLLHALMEIASVDSRAVAALQSVATNDKEHKATAAILALKETRNVSGLSMALIEHTESSLTQLSSVATDAIVSNEDLVHRYMTFVETLTTKEQQSLHALKTILSSSYRHPSVVSWIEESILGTAEFTNWHVELLKIVLEAYRGQPLPLSWQSGLANRIDNFDDQSGEMIRKIGETNVSKDAKRLIASISKRADSENLVTAMTAISAVPKGLVTVSVPQQTLIVQAILDSNHPNRDLAWQCLKRADWDTEAWNLLLSSLPHQGPIELPVFAESLATSRVAKKAESATSLIKALETTPASRSLSPEQMESWFKGHSEEVKNELKEMISRVFSPPADMSARIDEVMATLEAGDANLGQDVFRSSKAACNACHRIGYVGGTIGPELTRIGQSRTRRDFVEAIVFPSHRVAQGFHSVSILTDDDEVYSGLVANEDTNRIELILSAEKRISLDKKNIVKRMQSTTSIMPAGIERILTAKELSDLVAFLEQSK